MQSWTNKDPNELIKLYPAIQDQLNSMSRLQWKIDHDVLVAQGFPQTNDLYIALRTTTLVGNDWSVYLRYRNHDCRTDMLITLKNMDDLIAVFRGWLIIFESDMPRGVQQQMELTNRP